MKQREDYFSKNPISGQSTSEKYDPGPQADPYIQQQMDAKNWKDPKVQEYLSARLEWRNTQRAKLGLLPQDSYGNIITSAGSGGRRYTRNIKRGKISSGKIKLGGVPKKGIQLKVKQTNAQAPKIKQPKIKASGVKQATYKVKFATNLPKKTKITKRA